MQQQSYGTGSSPAHQSSGNDVSPYTGIRCYDIDRALRLLPEASQAELAAIEHGTLPYGRYLEILGARASRVQRHLEYHATILRERGWL